MVDALKRLIRNLVPEVNTQFVRASDFALQECLGLPEAHRISIEQLDERRDRNSVLAIRNLDRMRLRGLSGGTFSQWKLWSGFSLRETGRFAVERPTAPRLADGGPASAREGHGFAPIRPNHA